MDFEEIRRHAIVAMFSDDVLMERLVLKGGNAISIVLGLSPRVSLDLDFSMEGDFSDPDDARRRIERALSGRFDSAGYTVFDLKFEPRPLRPAEGRPKTWGGYSIDFRLLEKAKYGSLPTADDRRRNALVVGPGQARVFHIDISKHEHCRAKERARLDPYVVYVYTPTAIVIEKLRALCQQLPDYKYIGDKLRRPRPRDFFDIYTIMKARPIDLLTPENLELARNIFSAKDVPLGFLGKLEGQKAFHELEFRAVQDTVPGATEPFDVYFNWVLDLIRRLDPLWNK